MRSAPTAFVGAFVSLLAGFGVLAHPATGFSQTDTEFEIVEPNGVLADPSGDLLVSDIGTHRILRRSTEGRLSLVAGGGKRGFAGDGGNARDALLSGPHDLARDTDGNLVFADTHNHRVRRIDSLGVISTVAGDGRAAFTGDGGPATHASLNNPQGIAFGPMGILLIADTFNHVVRRVDRRGTISTFAGSEAGLAGDGQAATKAQLSLPMAVAVAPNGDVWISDAGNSRIRTVTTDGIIRTIAGSGLGSGLGGAGFDGDGRSLDQAKLFSATDIRFDRSGQAYIADNGNCRVRLVTWGTIVTIVGKGTPGYSGDGGSALTAEIGPPTKLALDGSGHLYIADRSNHCIRKVDAKGRIATLIHGRKPLLAPKSAHSNEQSR